MSSKGLILVIDTCGATGSLVVARVHAHGGATLLAHGELPGKTFASLLVPTIQDLLKQVAGTLDDLAAIAVVHGPGSFTGVRIGVSAAKALSEATEKPLIALSRLAVLAHKAQQSGSVCAVLDAGRHEYYAGLYRDGERLHEQLMSVPEVMVAAESARILTCEPAAAQAFARANALNIEGLKAADALPLAAQRLYAGDFDDALTLDGNYLRRSDIELFGHSVPYSGPLEAPTK